MFVSGMDVTDVVDDVGGHGHAAVGSLSVANCASQRAGSWPSAYRFFLRGRFERRRGA